MNIECVYYVIDVVFLTKILGFFDLKKNEVLYGLRVFII